MIIMPRLPQGPGTVSLHSDAPRATLQQDAPKNAIFSTIRAPGIHAALTIENSQI